MTRQQNKQLIWAGAFGLCSTFLLAGANALLHFSSMQNTNIESVITSIATLIFLLSAIALWLGLGARLLTRFYSGHRPRPGSYYDHLESLKMEQWLRGLGMWVDDPNHLDNSGDKK
jgi:hypothetical protein